MAVLNQHHISIHDQNRGAAIFCLICVGFFALIGAVTYLANLL